MSHDAILEQFFYLVFFALFYGGLVENINVTLKICSVNVEDTQGD